MIGRFMHRVWPRLESFALKSLWRALSRKATDMSVSTAARSCVILAPHADDETLGCGGLIMTKRAAGARVNVIIATDGAATHPDVPRQILTAEALVELREEETRAACKELGVDFAHLKFLRLPDGALASRAADLEADLAAEIAKIAPEEVYVCALADGHRDHKALARATRVLGERGELGNAMLWEYPVWYWSFRSWRPAATGNSRGFVAAIAEMRRAARDTVVFSVSLEKLDVRKRTALDCHRSQLGTLEEEPAWDGLPADFLENFFKDRELFFQVPYEVQETGPRP